MCIVKSVGNESFGSDINTGTHVYRQSPPKPILYKETFDKLSNRQKNNVSFFTENFSQAFPGPKPILYKETFGKLPNEQEKIVSFVTEKYSHAFPGPKDLRRHTMPSRKVVFPQSTAKGDCSVEYGCEYVVNDTHYTKSPR